MTDTSSIQYKVERVLRGIAFVVHFFTCAVIFTIEFFVRPYWHKLDEKCGNYFSKNFYRGALYEYLVTFWVRGNLWTFGVDYKVEYKTEMPKNNRDNAVIMFSHGSNLDPPLIGVTWPNFSSFVAKKELFKVPILGFFLKVNAQVPIDRNDRTSAIGSLNIAGELAQKEAKTIAIAPEGTRRRSESTGPDHLLPFKKGPFHLAKSVKRDIVPVVVMGANRLWKPGQILPRPGTAIVRYLERIPAEFVEKATVEELQAEVEKRMKANIDIVDDRVIYNQDGRNFSYVFLMLILFYNFLSFVMRWIL